MRADLRTWHPEQNAFVYTKLGKEFFEKRPTLTRASEQPSRFPADALSALYRAERDVVRATAADALSVRGKEKDAVGQRTSRKGELLVYLFYCCTPP